MKLNARQLRTIDPEACPQPAQRLPFYLISDSLYKCQNVGGLFRLSDAVAASHYFIAGATELPPNGKIRSASSGTYKTVPWSDYPTAVSAIRTARQQIPGLTVLAIEQGDTDFPAVSYDSYLYKFPLALVVGNETSGVSLDAKKEVDGIVEIPLHGVNSSLNVIVAAAIVAYHALRYISHV